MANQFDVNARASAARIASPTSVHGHYVLAEKRRRRMPPRL